MNTYQLVFSPNDVRAVLGVSEHDIEDATLESEIFKGRLTLALNKLHPDLAQTLVEFHERDPLTDPALTETEAGIYLRGRIYSTYVYALIVAPTAPLFALKKESDGRATGERFTDAFKDLQSYLDEQVKNLANSILDALEADGWDVERVPFYFTTFRASLGEDPVTGEAR